MAYSPDGRFLATSRYPIHSYGVESQWLAPRTGSVWVWDSGEVAAVFRGAGLTYHSLQFTSDGKSLIAPGADGVMAWDARSGIVSQVSPTPLDAISPDGKLAAQQADEEDTLVLVKLGSQSVIQTFRTPGERQTPHLFSPDGSLLACLAVDGGGAQQLLLWDLATGELRTRFEISVHSRFFFCFSPDGRFFASASIDSPAVTIWQCRDGRVLRRLDMGSEHIWGLAFSADGTMIAACGESTESDAGHVRVWDVESGTEKAHLVDRSTWGITALAFSPHGRVLATGDGNGNVKLWTIPRSEDKAP